MTVTQSETVVLDPPADAIEHIDLDPVDMRQSKEIDDTATISTEERPSEVAQIVVTAPIAIGAERGAQVVTCTVAPCSVDDSPDAPKHFPAGAKIFDPLYYDFK